MPEPLAYFISFRTYGTWLHGDPRGSVDPDHNVHGTPFLEPDDSRQAFEHDPMNGGPIELSPAHRALIAKTIVEVATHRRWKIHVQNVRTNHVHIVVSAPDSSAEKVMNDFKSWATRRLREANLISPTAQLWSRHGSTPHLFNLHALESAIHYVANLQ